MSISELSFSRDGQYLETDSGLLHLQPSSPDALPKAQPFYNIFANADWVTRDGESLLWLLIAEGHVRLSDAIS
jgi:hypothetical protein